MKKAGKIIMVVTAFVAIGERVMSLIKKRNKLTDELSKADDLIIRQECYISFIRSDMKNEFLSYKEGVFCEDTKEANEKFYNISVKPFLDVWYKR